MIYKWIYSELQLAAQVAFLLLSYCFGEKVHVHKFHRYFSGKHAYVTSNTSEVLYRDFINHGPVQRHILLLPRP